MTIQPSKFVLVRVESDMYKDHSVVKKADVLEELREYPGSESTYAVYELKYLLVSKLSSNFVEVRPAVPPTSRELPL